MIMILSLRTKLSDLYRHRRGLGFTWSRLQRRKYNIWIAKLVFHAKENPIRTWAEVLSLVSSRFNSPDDVYSPFVRIPPNPGLPQVPEWFPQLTNPGVRVCVGHQHSPSWPILACIMDYYSLFCGPGVISTKNEPHGEFTCRSSTLIVLADSGPFHGLLLNILGSQGDFHD